MKVDLSQEYKDNLYEKVLEKKKQRTKTRKVLLNTFLVFVSVVGIASYGFSKLSKGDYNNFFVSKTDNIEFNDEYEYFDDLGIKLEFINKDENSLTIGINIKYDNIKDYIVQVNEIKIKNADNNEYIVTQEQQNKIYESKIVNYNSKSDVSYYMVYNFIDKLDIKDIYVEIKNVTLSEMNCEENIYEYNLNWEKEISIE